MKRLLVCVLMSLPSVLFAQTDATKVDVVFNGGYDTVGADRGRPVILIAAALNVPDQVFRDAFKGVHPAGPASGGPTDAEARANKQVLMTALSPYGVTDDRLNEVSNYYRYRRFAGELWRHTPAKAYATVNNGVVTGITIVDPGSGYSSPPEVSVAGMPSVKLAASVVYATDFAKNGSIKEITFDTTPTASAP